LRAAIVGGIEQYAPNCGRGKKKIRRRGLCADDARRCNGLD